MSGQNNPFLFKSFPNDLSNDQKPLFLVMKDNKDLNTNSKKFQNSINIENFRKTNFFDPSKSNLDDINFESDVFKNDSFSNNLFLKQNDEPPSENIKQEEKMQNKIRSNISSLNQNNNYKVIMKKKNPVKKRKQNKKNKRNNSRISRDNSNNSSIYGKSNFPSKRSKSSTKSSKRTKRSKTEIIIPDSPDDYLSIDSDSDEEEVNNVNHFNKEEKSNYNNNYNKSSYLNNIIDEKENTLKNKEIKEQIEQELDGFDLMTVDLKSLFRDSNFKKKYLKDLNAKIKIVYFDKNQIPLQAVFCFCGKNGNIFGREKKLFSGAYSKNEFIEFCEKLIMNKSSATVKLLMDFADMNKDNYKDWMKSNDNLFIDFYFLVDILNYD